MEKKLNFDLMLSLKEISLRRLTVILWTHTDILASFDERDIEDKVKDKISKLALPPLLMEQMMYLIKPIESEIRNWKLFHVKDINISPGRIDVHILQNLCWTVLGTVDFQETAKNLIRFKMLHILQRYRLACLYCLDDYIPTLWKKLPEWRKDYFYKKDPFYCGTHSLLEFSWPFILKGEESKLDSMARRSIGSSATFNQYAFEKSAYNGNKAATEYFFRKLTSVERESSLFKTAQAAIMHRLGHYDLLGDFPEGKLSETICYLLSLMNLEQQMEICKEYTGHVFMCLLDWPWQNIFWVFAEPFWSFLETNPYIGLLNRIGEKIKSCHFHKKMFKKFFLCGSSYNRKCFLDYSLRMFFNYQDSETFKFILRNVDSADIKTLISTRDTLEIFFESIMGGRGDLVQICLQEATLSKEDREELKEDFFEFLTGMEISNVSTRDNILKQFFQFLD